MKPVRPSSYLRQFRESGRAWSLTVFVFAGGFWTTVFGLIWNWNLDWPIVGACWAALLVYWGWYHKD